MAQKNPSIPTDTLVASYLSEAETAQMLGCSVHKLRKDRCLSRGIPYHILGTRSIRYKPADIHTYMNGQYVSFN